jgi:hypothetical protein
MQNRGRILLRVGLIVFLFCFGHFFSIPLHAQDIEVKGVIFDISQRTPLEAVTVMATNGTGTMTDEFGRYTIWVRPTDSVYFSYQGRETAKYPVMKMEDYRQFNMALHVYTYSLPNVTVRPPNYRTGFGSKPVGLWKIF